MARSGNRARSFIEVYISKALKSSRHTPIISLYTFPAGRLRVACKTAKKALETLKSN